MSCGAVMAQPWSAVGVTASLLLLLMMGACAGDDHPQPSVSTPPAGSREPSLVQLPPDLSTETIAFVRTDTDGTAAALQNYSGDGDGCVSRRQISRKDAV